jgi:hypothetical protein
LKLSSIAFVLLLSASTAGAEPLRPQLQADLGLSVVAIGYEHPLGTHVAVMAGAGLFGTYFLPWFDLGDNVVGGVGDLRATWFAGDDGRGLYVTPYVRAGYAGGTHEGTNVEGAGLALTTGVFVGYGFRLTDKLDLRIGAGGQYIYLGGDHGVGASTPFVALDTILGYRL